MKIYSSPEVKAEEPMVNETPVVEPIPPVVNNNSQATNVIPNTTEEMPANTLNNNLANNSINNNVNNVLPENNMPNPQAEKISNCFRSKFSKYYWNSTYSWTT